MRKALCGLLLGASLFALPLKTWAQDGKTDYEYNLLWKNWKIGEAKCNSDTVNFNLKGIHDLDFYKTERTYQEISKFIDSEETYFYVKEGDSWKFKDYFYPLDEEGKASKKRESKAELVGKVYSSEVVVGTEIFRELERKVVPDTLRILVFGEVYTFGKKSEKNLKNRLVEIQYDLPYFPTHESDKVRLKEPVKVYLKKEEDKNFIVGGKTNIQYKLGFWLNFKFDVGEKNYLKK
jgi:uncharacterized protein YozE (UPF0346 family)